MCEKALIMISLLLILGSVICVLLYRFLTELLRQIPNRNEDFDVFISEAELDCVSSVTTKSTRKADLCHLQPS
jgi:hypothetical protein